MKFVIIDAGGQTILSIPPLCHWTQQIFQIRYRSQELTYPLPHYASEHNEFHKLPIQSNPSVNPIQSKCKSNPIHMQIQSYPKFYQSNHSLSVILFLTTDSQNWLTDLHSTSSLTTDSQNWLTDLHSTSNFSI